MPPFCIKCQTYMEDGKCKCPPKVTLHRVWRFAWDCPACGKRVEQNWTATDVECPHCDAQFPAVVWKP